MADTRIDELYRALQDKGYPDELCREIAYKHMNTDYTATRMLGYLYRVTSPRVEDVIDEMLAIRSTVAVPGFYDLILVHEQIPLGVQMLSSQKHFAEHYR